MQLLTWILIGTVIGWGTGKALKGNGYGPFMDIFMGVGGAVLGGFLITAAGLSGYGGLMVTTLGVMMSAALVTLLAAYANGRRVYARLL
jgi:uncharacterized membrane protein YeaQ/YmgE (transglycosylase-associated protein family)